MFPDLVVLAAVDSHGPAVLHLGPDVEALHAAIDNLRHNTGREAGGQGVAPLAVRTTRRPEHQTVTNNFVSYNPIDNHLSTQKVFDHDRPFSDTNRELEC